MCLYFPSASLYVSTPHCPLCPPRSKCPLCNLCVCVLCISVCCVSVSSVQVSAPSSLFTRGPSQPVSPSSFPAAGADLLFSLSTKPWCRAERSVPGGHEEAAWPAAARDPQLGVVAAWPPSLLDPTWPARPVLLSLVNSRQWTPGRETQYVARRING